MPSRCSRPQGPIIAITQCSLSDSIASCILLACFAPSELQISWAGVLYWQRPRRWWCERQCLVALENAGCEACIWDSHSKALTSLENPVCQSLHMAQSIQDLSPSVSDLSVVSSALLGHPHKWSRACSKDALWVLQALCSKQEH